MPVISPRRYSTTTGSSSYLPPSVGGTTSSLAKASSSYGSSGYGSSYRSSSLSNSSSSYSSGGYSSGTSPASSYLSRNSAYRSSLYNSSSSLSGTSAISPLSYRPSSYLSGGNNDTTATSRFGVSSNRYTRSSSDRETTRRITGKTQHNNNINTNRSKTLQTKPPIVGSSSSIRNQRPSSESRSRDNSLTRVTSKSDPNSNCINNNNSESIESKNKISSSLSSSSLARQVATSGLDLYEKYSPAHYIPKCELSRSRSLSEATSNKYINDNGLSNSSSNVHQLLQTKEINNKQEKQENDTQNQKSSSPSHQTTSSSSSSKDISTAQLASKVKKLCAVSTIATNNQSKSASSVVAINNNSTTITNENNYSNNASNSSTSYLKYPVKQLNKSTTPQYLAGLNLNAKHYNNHYIHDNITNTTNSITSVKPICSVVNIVTNHIQNPSEHDSKHSNVIKTATTVQSHQINTSSILYSTYNNNSPPNSITSCNKFDRKLRNNYTTITTTSIPASATFSKEQATQLSSFSAVPSGSTNCSSQVFCNDLNTKSSIINANALLKAAKSNLKPTKQFLSNKIDDKTMSSYYCASNGNINNPNSDCSNSTTTPVTLVNNIAPSSSSSSPSSPTILSTGGGDKSKSLKTNKTNILDFRLEFYKNKLQSGENTTAGSLSAINGSVAAKGGNNTNNNNNNQFIGLTYREPNFLKTECELARSQVVRSDQNSSNHSYENNNIILNNGQEKLNKYEKNIIKPLVHKPTNNKLQQLSRTLSNNNMNCLQNSPDLLDDIKYIDSDDSERQQNHHNHHHHHHHNNHQHHHHHSHHHNNSQSKSASSSATAAGTTTVVCPSPSKLIANRKDLSYVTNNKTSTLPLTSKHHRDLIHSDSSPNKNATNNKYNTLNDFKRIPSSLSNNFKSSHYKTNDVLSSSSSSPSSSTTTPIKTIISNNLTKSTVTMIHHNGTASRESTPSNSPQTLRRRNALSNSSNLLQNSNEGLSTSSSSLKSTSVLQPQQQQQSSYSPVTINDKKLSNKLCDNDESVRNASIRSALPPSPTPSRYWDREGRSSLASRNQNDSDDSTTTKSSLSTSNSYDKTATEGLCGLRNIGNTCYMNSVIQCLSHTRELTKFLKTHMGIKSSSKDHQILIEFSKLIREMWSPNVRSVTPLELKSAFSTKHRMYSGYNQQDAQEFLRFFLDSLHSSLNSGVKGEQLKIDDSLSDNKKADLTWEWYAKIENSVVRDLFVGQLKSTLKCTVCGNTSVTFDPFWDLSVPLPSSSRCKLDACLELFIREEVLDGDEMPTCSKCQTRRKCTKSFTIQRFPKYLVIHLKRFSETRWSKLSNVVEFPTGERELNMAPYASNSNGSATYSLYGISNHMGSTAGGHYVALCKHPTTKKWHEFNDNVVSDDLSDSVLVSSSAYILFYERA